MKVIEIILAIIGCCAIVLGILHRRVIKALMNGDPIPKAPATHVWVKNRKTKK